VGKREIGEEVKMRSSEGMAFQFIIEEQKGKREFSYQMRGAILCGYTGRNQSAVSAHVLS
jgi:hypothetical protein